MDRVEGPEGPAHGNGAGGLANAAIDLPQLTPGLDRGPARLDEGEA